MSKECDERLERIDDMANDALNATYNGDEDAIEKDNAWEEAWEKYKDDGCCNDCDIEDDR